VDCVRVGTNEANEALSQWVIYSISGFSNLQLSWPRSAIWWIGIKDPDGLLGRKSADQENPRFRISRVSG
jgi:hypothetical protein